MIEQHGERAAGEQVERDRADEPSPSIASRTAATPPLFAVAHQDAPYAQQLFLILQPRTHR